MSQSDALPAVPALRRVAVVTNARAGALVDASDGLKALFEEAGVAAVFIDNEAGTLPERMAAAMALVRDGAAEAVVVAGGDGTVACAAQVLAGAEGQPGVPLGVLPFGTMNLLAKDLGLPVGDTAAAVRRLVQGRMRRIDVGEVNGHVFLCASMLGLPARLGRHREEARGASGLLWLRMARAAVRGLRQMVMFRAVAEIGDERVRVVTPALTIAVNEVEEASGAAFARTRLDGGVLAMYTVGGRGAAALLRFVARVAVRRWRRDPGLREWVAPAITLHRGRRGRVTRVMNDGELLLLTPPLAYTVRAGALTVLGAAGGDAA